MRTTLWLLLVLNGLAAAVWLAGFSVPPKPVVNVAISTTPGAIPLQLLSELPALPPRLDALPADFKAPPGEPAGDSPLPAEPAVPEVAETLASATELVAGGSQAPAVSPVPDGESLQVPEQPADGPVPTSTVADAVAPSPATPEQPVEADDAPACYRTPILAADAYEAVGAVLRGAELGEPTLQPQGRARPRHWVYWVGAADELAGIEKRLKAAGVRDWYRLPVTDGMSRISLGVYGQADGARRRQRELAAKAVQTQIRERYTPPAKLRWTVNARPAAVDAAADRLQRRSVRLEPCS